MRLTPNRRCTRLLTVAFRASLMMALEASWVKAFWLVCCSWADSSVVCPKRQQRDDIGLGQRRLGAVGHLQLVGRPIQVERDVVIANLGGSLQVE